MGLKSQLVILHMEMTHYIHILWAVIMHVHCCSCSTAALFYSTVTFTLILNVGAHIDVSHFLWSNNPAVLTLWGSSIDRTLFDYCFIFHATEITFCWVSREQERLHRIYICSVMLFFLNNLFYFNLQYLLQMFNRKQWAETSWACRKNLEGVQTIDWI